MSEGAAAMHRTVPTSDSTVVSSVRTLLNRVIDYAGLFPPASLNMGAAVTEYAEHRRGPDSWILGRFVLPAARLEEFDAAAGETVPREGRYSWALSALLGSDLEEDVERIEHFNERHRDARAGAVVVDTVELKAHSTRDVARAGELLDRRFDSYVEIPVTDDPAELVDAISHTQAKAKIRTGGVTSDAFPSSANVARFMERCVAHGVAFKATAGLHHPWRSDYRLTYAADAPQGTMFGFLNVLLATAAVRAGWSTDDYSSILEERDPRVVCFDERGVRWRDRQLTTAMLECARESMVAFGSCSFREPLADLRSLSPALL
jgi:hypothetical protein